MPTTRVEMPNGLIFRTNSARRYIVVCWISAMAKWQIEYRTDKESNALARWREECGHGVWANIIDTETKAVIR